MFRRKWPVALAVLFVAQLAWYIVYTQRIVEALRSNVETLSVIYARIQSGVSDPTPGAAETALFDLQGTVLHSGAPLIVTGPGDTVLAAQNLPFPADLETRMGQERVRSYAGRLDLRRPPVGDTDIALIHFGDPPEVTRLRWIPWLQATGLLLTVFLGLLLIRLQRRAEGERAWTAMARELAHQLGTPISSLQGWMELLRLPGSERPRALGEGEIAREIQEDLRRLERISRRFELIGSEPELKEVSLVQVVEDLRSYLDARLPRLHSEVEFRVDLPPDLPAVRGSGVLLSWALENLVKNSLDALAGTGGTIRIGAKVEERGGVVLRVRDSGPGVPPELRTRVFDPGVSTKAGGWGVGLALTRRIVEGVHGGRIYLVEGPGRGAEFEIRLPAFTE